MSDSERDFESIMLALRGENGGFNPSVMDMWPHHMSQLDNNLVHQHTAHGADYTQNGFLLSPPPGIYQHSAVVAGTSPGTPPKTPTNLRFYDTQSSPWHPAVKSCTTWVV